MEPSPRIESLLRAVEPERRRVLEHPLYAEVDDLASLRVFMTHHAFAVWDFMCLLKSLQRRLTCTTHPWLPPRSTVAARFINEIVLGEESDEISPGTFISHYDLYLQAMEEVQADPSLVRDYIDMLATGFPAKDALRGMPIPRATREFVLGTLALCERPATEADTVEVAASFLFGREDLVPLMFERLVARIGEAGLKAPSFLTYLQRHIEVDGGQHGPLATRLLHALCGEDDALWLRATEGARTALTARASLWDGVRAEVKARRWVR